MRGFCKELYTKWQIIEQIIMGLCIVKLCQKTSFSIDVQGFSLSSLQHGLLLENRPAKTNTVGQMQLRAGLWEELTIMS